jgi:Uma2 family endonuclease
MTILDPLLNLPSSEELPCSDDTPVDNEDQNYIPNVLLFLLEFLWAARQDWFFGADMAIYHTTGPNPRVPIVPDGFLCLGVERHKGGGSRRSYVTWEENEVVPTLVLEVVSWTPGEEYDSKAEKYARLGVLYYVIHNPDYWQRDRHQPFEVYRLVEGRYQLQIGEPYWMEEIGLGIGRYIETSGSRQRQLLGWFDQNRQRLQPPQELLIRARQQAEQERQRAEQERQRADRAEQVQRSAIVQLLAMGMSREQISQTLSLSPEEVDRVVD